MHVLTQQWHSGNREQGKQGKQAIAVVEVAFVVSSFDKQFLKSSTQGMHVWLVVLQSTHEAA